MKDHIVEACQLPKSNNRNFTQSCTTRHPKSKVVHNLASEVLKLVIWSSLQHLRAEKVKMTYNYMRCILFCLWGYRSHSLLFQRVFGWFSDICMFLAKIKLHALILSAFEGFDELCVDNEHLWRPTLTKHGFSTTKGKKVTINLDILCVSVLTSKGPYRECQVCQVATHPERNLIVAFSSCTSLFMAPYRCFSEKTDRCVPYTLTVRVYAQTLCYIHIDNKSVCLTHDRDFHRRTGSRRAWAPRGPTRFDKRNVECSSSLWSTQLWRCSRSSARSALFEVCIRLVLIHVVRRQPLFV